MLQPPACACRRGRRRRGADELQITQNVWPLPGTCGSGSAAASSSSPNPYPLGFHLLPETCCRAGSYRQAIEMCESAGLCVVFAR